MLTGILTRIFDDGPLDGLVNNAAGNFISPTKDLSHKVLMQLLILSFMVLFT
jgi:hypothetical protein